MTPDTKSIVLISKDPNQISGIGTALCAHREYAYEECNGSLTEMNGRASKLAQMHDLILFQADSATEKDVAAIKMLREQNGQRAIILALSDASTTLADAQLLTRAGVDGVLAETISAQELEAEIAKRLKTVTPRSVATEETGPMGKIISVAQARGGVGATTLAVNLADHLLERRGRKGNQNRVALVDLDLQFGAISGFLDTKPNDALFQLAMDGNAPDATFLSHAMEQMSSGLSVLTAPSQIAPLDALQQHQVENLIETLQRQYDYVVFDMPRVLVDWLAPVLKCTDQMLMVTDSSVPAIQKARRLIDFYTEDHLGLPVEIVVNKEKKPMFQGRHHIEASKVLERPLRHWLPPDPKAAREAEDRGAPLSQVARSSALYKAIKRLTAASVADLSHKHTSKSKPQ